MAGNPTGWAATGVEAGTSIFVTRAIGPGSRCGGPSNSAGNELAPATTIVSARIAPLQNRFSAMLSMEPGDAASLRRGCAGHEALGGRLRDLRRAAQHAVLEEHAVGRRPV